MTSSFAERAQRLGMQRGEVMQQSVVRLGKEASRGLVQQPAHEQDRSEEDDRESRCTHDVVERLHSQATSPAGVTVAVQSSTRAFLQLCSVSAQKALCTTAPPAHWTAVFLMLLLQNQPLLRP